MVDLDLQPPVDRSKVPPLTDQTRAEVREIIARYPRSRSALLPMLHLVQSVQGYVSPDGIALCSEELDLTKAEVGAVATFYPMYRRRPAGTYHVGVCTNTLCAVLGGDAIMDALKEHTGLKHNQTSEDGTISLEHIECNAACDYAPVVMVNWEFYDNQTPQSARELVDACKAGNPPQPTRGPSKLVTFKEMSRVLAGFNDGLGQEGAAAGHASLIGLELAKQRGDTAPSYPGTES
ncbi:MAG: NADH-quinone oxidoreductase subunit NuoE [Frankiales bacterium]|nr:NADH-quinone oxidoreductase subunit NuoE [Frankiales bacterium]